MIPARFVIEYPSRCMDLFQMMEPIARERQLLGSFSLIVATSVFMIPYERMKRAHPLNEAGQQGGLDAAIRRVERQRFSEAEFWNGEKMQHWRFSRIMTDANSTGGWLDENDLHPMAPNAANSIDWRRVNDVIRVVRNALAHGNVVYLDEQGFETKGSQVQYLAFLSRYEETPEQQKKAKTYRLAVTTEEGFFKFVKAWATWLGKLPAENRLEEASV